jgi:hypothetical protein
MPDYTPRKCFRCSQAATPVVMFGTFLFPFIANEAASETRNTYLLFTAKTRQIRRYRLLRNVSSFHSDKKISVKNQPLKNFR